MLDNRPPNAPTEEPPAAGQTHARLSWKWLRRGAWFGVCAAGLLWLAHAPFIRGWVLAELASRLGARYGVSIVATGLHYNLLGLSASIDECRVVVPSAAQKPHSVVAARNVKAVFGRGILVGRLDVRILDADEVVVTLRAAGGTPPPPRRVVQRSSETQMLPLSAAQINIRSFGLEYDDPNGVGLLSVGGGTLRLGGDSAGKLEGAVGVAALSLTSDHARVRLAHVQANVAIDSNAVVLEPTRLEAGDQALHPSGAVTLTGNHAGYDLGLEANFPIDLLNDWFPTLPRGTGNLAARVRVSGPLEQPQVKVNVQTAGATWPRFALPTTSLEAVVSPRGIDVSRLDVSAPPARLVASGHLSFDDSARSVTRARWYGVSPGAVAHAMRTRLSTVPRVRTSGTAELTWNGMVPTVGTLGGALSADLAAPDSQKEAGAIRASLTPQQWRVEARQPLGSGTGARLEATLKPDGDRLSRSAVSGSIEIGIRDARETIDRLRPLGVPSVDFPAAIERLPVEVSATLSGSLGQPHAAGTARSSGLSVKSLGMLNAEASFETSLDLLTVERLRITDAQGSAVEARGTVTYASLSSNGSFEAAAPTKLLETTLPANWTTAGSIDARGSWKGTLRDPFAEVQVTGGQVAVNGLTPGPLSATAFLEGGSVRVDGRVPDLGAAMRAQFTLVKPFTFTASGSLDNTNLARVATLAPAGANLPAIAGTLTAGIDVAGQFTSLALLSTHVRLERLDARVAQHPVVLIGPADIRIAASEVSVAALRLQTGAATVAADGRLDKAGTGVMELTVDTPASELAGWLDASGSQTPLTADGRVHIDARATGPLGAVSLEGRANVELQQVKAGDRKVAENVRAGIAITRNTIEASQITGTILGGALDVALSAPTDWVAEYLPKQLGIAHAPGAVARVKGRVVVPASALIDFQGDGTAPPATAPPATTPPATGSLTISVDGSALHPSLAALDGTVTVAGEDVTVQEVPFSLERPVVLSVRNGRVLVDDAQLRARGTSFTLRGGAALTDPYDVDLSLTASGSLGFLAAALPGRPSGRVTADLRLSGPSGARTAVGTVTLEQAGFVSPVHRIAFSDWNGKVDVTAESLTALDVAGTVNGGTAVLRGRLPLAPASRDTSTLSLSVRDAFVEVIKGFKSQVDADLSVAHLEDAFRVGGTVTVVSGAYREPVTAMAALFANPGSPAAAARGRRTALDRVSFDVRLLAREPIIVDNSLGRVDLSPDMRLTGTAARPSLTGSLNALRDGHLTLAGRRYRILEGQALFTPRDGWLPQVNLSAETRVGEYTINIRARGPVDAIETSATSTPPLSDRDLQSLLVTGRTAGMTGESKDDEQFAIAAASSEILGFAGQMVGLDSLQIGRADFDIGATEVNPATRLTVTKSLGGRFRVILSENLDDNKLTWIIVVDPGRGYEFRFSQRDEGEHIVEFRQELEFGPGTSPKRAPARTRKTARPTVSRVVFSGTPGVPASALQQVVSTQAGRPFDVEAWQNDRERLETFYREAGYATAHVIPRRTVTETAGGELAEIEYHIDRGPRTILQIEGARLPDPVVKDILNAWSESVVSEFLRDESIRLVRRYLAGENHLRPSIEFSFDRPSDTTERVTLRISPGPAVRAKLVTFERDVVSEADIKARSSLRAAIDDAWTDPEPLLKEVQVLCRDRGYFTARASSDPIAFDNGDARLNIRVVDGPLARVERVAFVGVNDGRLAAVRAAARVEPGTAYLPGTGGEARNRVLDAYQNLGFRAADVQVTRTMGKDGGVALTFSVSEGAQSIVTAVRIDGVEATRPASVESAVTLKPGAPAGNRDAADTQSRLYGLGTFRSAEVRFEPTAVGKALGEGQIPVEAVVSLSEVRRYQLRYGVQLSDENGTGSQDLSSAIGVAADVRDRNFLGRGMTLGASGRYEANLQNSRGMLFLPRYLHQKLDSHLFVTWQKERTTEHDVTVDDTERDVTFQQRFLVRHGVEVSWAYSYNRREFQLVPTTFAGTEKVPGTLASLQLGLILDRRDSPFDASRGWFHSQNLQLGIRDLGSDVSYSRYLIRQYVYVPVGPLVLASGVRWGTLGHVAGTPPLSITDLFFDAGGSQTVRGYDQDGLAAISAFDVPLGGTQLLILNQEIRFPIFKWFKGAAFFDAGNTFRRMSDVGLSNLAVGAGLGLRIKTPLAPFRIDAGLPIGPFGDRRLRWYFSVGQMF